MEWMDAARGSKSNLELTVTGEDLGDPIRLSTERAVCLDGSPTS